MNNLNSFNIGVDIEKIDRFVSYINNPHLLSKIYTPLEIRYCLSKTKPSQHLAVRFAAKEAVIKALSGLGIKDVFYEDIEIIKEADGNPRIIIKNKHPEKLNFKISLSHSDTEAVAFVVVLLETE